MIQDAWSGSVWTGPGQGQLDPLKETKASILRIKNHLGTYEDEFVAITGNDWDGAMNRLSREEKHLENVGLSAELEVKEDEVSDQIEEGVSE